MPRTLRLPILLIGFSFLPADVIPAAPQAQTDRQDTPAPKRAATPEEAAHVIDLRSFPMIPGGEPRRSPVLASVSYEAPGTVKDGFAFIRQELFRREWKELPGGYESESSSNGTFERDGYRLSVSVSTGRSDQANSVDVQIINHGNVDLSALPTPSGTESLFDSPLVSMSMTERPVAEAAAELRTLLLAAGWEPYGSAGDTQHFRQNAVQLLATVASSPAQQGKTMINFTAQLLSLELPLPSNAERAQYSDSPPQLSFDVGLSFDDVAQFYRQALAAHSWQPTTDELIKIDFRHFLVFRNSQKDMLELQLTTFEGKTRGLLQFSSAAEIAEKEKKLAAEREKREAMANKPKPSLTIALPAGAKRVEESGREIEFTVAIGQAEGVVASIQQQLIADGWKTEDATVQPMFGALTMKKESQTVALTYVEAGVLPPEITISSLEVELQIAKTP